MSGQVSLLRTGIVTVQTLEGTHTWTQKEQHTASLTHLDGDYLCDLLPSVCPVPTCVCPDVLDVVALAVREVGALAAGVQFAGEVVPQVFPPVVLADGGVRTQRALEHSAETPIRHVIFDI